MSYYEEKKISDSEENIENIKKDFSEKRKVIKKLTARGFFTLLVQGPAIGWMIFIALSMTVLIYTIPVKLVYNVAKFLWNLIP